VARDRRLPAALAWGLGGTAAVASLALSGILPVAPWLATPLVVAEAVRPVDALVVLGAGTYDDRTLTPDGAYRLVHAIQMLKAGQASLMILSGGTHRGTRQSDARVMADVAASLGVDPCSLVLDEAPTSTWAQAESVARIAAARRLRTLGLVTSPLHSYRASKAFRRAGLDVVSLPIGPDFDPRLLSVGEDHVAGRVDVIVHALYEYVAIAAYRVRGRL